MAQSFPGVNATDLIRDSRDPLLSRDLANRSNNEGTNFPVDFLVLGMQCYRSDLGTLFMLTAMVPTAVWEQIPTIDNLGTAALKNIGTADDTIPLNNTENTFSATQHFTAAIAVDLDDNKLVGQNGSLDFTGPAFLNAKLGQKVQFAVDDIAYVTVDTDGGFVVGAPSGGTKGAGTINTVGLYISGNAVGTAATANVGSGAADIPTNASLGGLAYKSSVQSADVETGAVTADKMGMNAVQTPAVQNGAITNDKLGSGVAKLIGHVVWNPSTNTIVEAVGCMPMNLAGQWNWRFTFSAAQADAKYLVQSEIPLGGSLDTGHTLATSGRNHVVGNKGLNTFDVAFLGQATDGMFYGFIPNQNVTLFVYAVGA